MSKKKYQQIKPEDLRPQEIKAIKQEVHEEDSIFQGLKPMAINQSYLSQNDYEEFTRLTISKKIKGIILFWAIASMLLGGALLLTTLFFDQQISWVQAALGIVLLAFGSIFIIYFFVIMPKNTAVSYYKNDQKFAENGEESYRTFIFYENGVRTGISDGRKNQVLYQSIERTYESDNLFAFRLDLQHGYVMKKDGFEFGDLSLVKDLMNGNLKDPKNRDKLPVTGGCCGKFN